jgi:hypothetical protein
MTQLAEVYVGLGIRLPKEDLEHLRVGLSDAARRTVPRLFGQVPQIEVQVQEGTVKTRTTVLGTIASLLITYGGLREALNYAHEDTKTLLKVVTDIIDHAGVPREYITRAEVRNSAPQLLRRALMRLEELQRAGRQISPRQYEAEITAARSEIKAALALMDEADSI